MWECGWFVLQTSYSTFDHTKLREEIRTHPSHYEFHDRPGHESSSGSVQRWATQVRRKLLYTSDGTVRAQVSQLHFPKYSFICLVFATGCSMLDTRHSTESPLRQHRGSELSDSNLGCHLRLRRFRPIREGHLRR